MLHGFGPADSAMQISILLYGFGHADFARQISILLRGFGHADFARQISILLQASAMPIPQGEFLFCLAAPRWMRLAFSTNSSYAFWASYSSLMASASIALASSMICWITHDSSA